MLVLSLVQHLQAVQNAAARLVSGTRRPEHITPVLRQLHWLPVRQRIEFNTRTAEMGKFTLFDF